MQRVVPVVVAAVTESAEAVAAEAQTIVPVDTGELRDSIAAGPVALIGTTVQGSVEATAPYAAYVEFGTGQRGEASAGAGPGPYSPDWPGMPAQPYMRPALDTARPAILEAFAKRGLKIA
jgi:HK97 gp10 family phage protein